MTKNHILNIYQQDDEKYYFSWDEGAAVGGPFNTEYEAHEAALQNGVDGKGFKCDNAPHRN